MGPIAGGFIAQSVGTRYTFIVIVGLCAIAALVGIPFLKETYGPVIRMRLAAKMLDPEEAVQMHSALAEEKNNKLMFLWLNLSRPAVLLSRSFICFILSLYMAL